MRDFIRPLILFAAALLLSGIAIKPANAQVIDRIEINHAGDEAEIQIWFDVRIHYLRDAFLNDNEIHIFIKLLEADPDRSNPDPEARTRLVPETMESPPSDFAPPFTVSFPELDSSLVITFGGPVSHFRVQPGKDGRSISIFIPANKPKGEIQSLVTVPQMNPRTPEEVEQDAKLLMNSAQDAIAHDQVVTAIEILNRLLSLQPNQQSQAGQELIGEAREKNGEFDKAHIEYELYLKRYPEAVDAAKVKGKLLQLPQGDARLILHTVKENDANGKLMVYGGLSQNYYKGVSHTDTTTADSNGVTSASLTSTNKSVLVSSLDMTGQKSTENANTNIVFRDVYNINFLEGQNNNNRLSAAYVEQSARDRSYVYRLGRQAGSGGGVRGSFDGVWMDFRASPAWRINGVVGTPVDFYNRDKESKIFTGVSIALTRLPKHWSGSGYFMQQKVGNILDRRAVGMETHYFSEQQKYTGLVEYDILFNAVNVATFQGNWTTGTGIDYDLLLDHRKSSPLQLTNALLGQTLPSISALLQSGMSLDALRADAQALSATSNLLLAGMTKPYSEHWKIGGDFRVANTSGTGDSGNIAATTGTGNSYIYTVHAIGNDLFLQNDLNVISASYVDDPIFKGRSLEFNRIETLRKNWRLDMSLQLYAENDQWGTHQTRITPSLKLNYHLNDSVSFEGEGGIEDTHTYSETQTDKTRRKYFYVGYRWDFR
jgi:tetratricopeptide (TPR) repeat protein